MKRTNKVIDKYFLFNFSKQIKKSSLVTRKNVLMKYANFVFKLASKKIIFYFIAVVYVLVIFAYSFLIPTFANYSPYTIYTFPIFSCLLVLFIASMFSYIAIEIYKTPIEDGTELIVLSKSIKRSEVFIIKYLVFIGITLAISFLGSITSLFSFATLRSIYKDNLFIFFGVLIATFLVAIVFGNIAIALCLYLKKLVSFLIVIAIGFLLSVSSIITAISIKTPSLIAYSSDKIKNFGQATLINLNGKNTDQNGLSYTRGLVSEISNADLSQYISTRLNNKTPNIQLDASRNYQLAFNLSPIKTFRYFDPIGQLSTLFTSGKPSISNSANQLVSGFINVPFELRFINLNFGDVTKFDTNTKLAKTHSWFILNSETKRLIEANNKTNESNKENKNTVLLNDVLFVVRLANSTSIGTWGDVVRIQSQSQQASNLGIRIDEAKYNEFFSPIKGSEEILENFVNRSGLRSNSNNDNNDDVLSVDWLIRRSGNLANLFSHINNLTTDYLDFLIGRFLSTRNYLGSSKKEKEQSIIDLNDVVLTAYSKYLNQNTINLKELLEELPTAVVNYHSSKAIDDYTTELIKKLLTFRLLNFAASSLNRLIGTDLDYGRFALLFLDFSPIPFTINSRRLFFIPFINMVPALFLDNFKPYEVVSYYNPFLLFVVYSLISFSFYYYCSYTFNKKDIF